MKNYRILLIGPSLKSMGGISQVIKIILNNHIDNRFQIDFLSTYEDRSNFGKLLVFIRSIIEFFIYLLKFKPNIIHTHFSINASIFRKSFFIICGKILGIKTIMHSHTGELEHFISKSNKFIKWFIIKILNTCDYVLIISSNDFEFYKGICTKSIVKVIRNPIPIQSNQSKLNTSQVISVGTLGKRKGTFDLIEAIDLIKDDFQNMKFLLIGNGEIRNARRIVAEKGLQNIIEIPGWLNSDEIKDIYLNSSIFVLPSYFEGMPLAILEAMSFGLPVISTNVNGIPDIVVDGETGILIEPGQIEKLGNEMRKLLLDKNLQKTMGENSKKRIVEYFSASSVLSELYSIYMEIDSKII